MTACALLLPYNDLQYGRERSQGMTRPVVLGSRSPGHDGSWVMQVFQGNNGLEHWAIQIDFFLELRHPEVQEPLLIVVGDILRSNWNLVEENLASIRIVGRKYNWHQRGAAILLKSIVCPLIYMNYMHRGEECMAFNWWKFSSGHNEPLQATPLQLP